MANRVSLGLYADTFRSEAETLDIALDLLRELDANAADKYTADNADFFGTDDDDDDDAEPYEWLSEMIDEVSELISDRLPDYQYAGYSDIGDGWGIWIDHEGIREGIYNGDIATYDNEGNIVVLAGILPSYVYSESDHGNPLLCRIEVETEKVW